MNEKLKLIGLIAVFISILFQSACGDTMKSGPGGLVINEIVANSADGGNDWIELFVTGKDPVYLGDYSLVDDSPKHKLAPLPDITLQPGEFFVIQATDTASENGSYYAPFKLGSDDCVTLYYKGFHVADVLDWGAKEALSGTSYGHLPDGTGKAQTLIPTPNEKNKSAQPSDETQPSDATPKSALVINEIVADDADGGNDWIELYVTGENPVYLGDYSLVDDDIKHTPAPLPDITLGPGEFFLIQATDKQPEDGSFYVPFKLGSDDCVTLYLDSNIVDVLDWGAGDAPIGTSYGRLPDGTGKAQTLIPTPNEKNNSAQPSDETSSDETPPPDVTPQPALVINEIVAADASGGNDWIELYVTSKDPVYLGDYSLVDDDIKHTPAPLPDITLEPGEFFLIQATDKQPEDGSFYAPFKLGSDDCVTLYYLDSDIVDVLDWKTGDAPIGTSCGRMPDGTGEAKTLIPTPGKANEASLSSRLFGRETLLFDQDSIQDTILDNDGDMLLRCKNGPPYPKASALCNGEFF